MKKTRYISLALVVALCFLMPTVAFAAEKGESSYLANSWRYRDGKPIEEVGGDENSAQSDFAPWSKNEDGYFINSSGNVIVGATMKGVDVSGWQGAINWNAVKASDVGYAIIKCGYGGNYIEQDDSYWKTNADACTALDIPFGVYLYSYATTVEKARSEAAHVLRLVAGYAPSFPIYYDLEDAKVGALSNGEIGDIAEAFCCAIEDAGYDVGIYANKNWWETRLTDAAFNNSDWHKWVAQWNSVCTYNGGYTMWQCTNSGTVSGISGGVDLDFWFGNVVGKKPYKGAVECPQQNNKYSVSDSVYVQGWAICGEGITSVTCSINGGGEVPLEQYARADIAAANPGYPAGQEGFRYSFPCAQFPIGGSTLTFYAYSGDGSGLTVGERDITVKSESGTGHTLALTETSVAIQYKSAHKLNYTYDGDTAVVTWRSSDASVVTVDENGGLVTKGTGSAKITCEITDSDGSAYRETCTVTVHYVWWQWLIRIFLFGWVWY